MRISSPQLLLVRWLYCSSRDQTTIYVLSQLSVGAFLNDWDSGVCLGVRCPCSHSIIATDPHFRCSSSIFSPCEFSTCFSEHLPTRGCPGWVRASSYPWFSWMGQSIFLPVVVPDGSEHRHTCDCPGWVWEKW